jgi:hypothetical protein
MKSRRQAFPLEVTPQRKLCFFSSAVQQIQVNPAYGLANVELNAPVTDHSLFSIGSIGKTEDIDCNYCGFFAKHLNGALPRLHL